MPALADEFPSDGYMLEDMVYEEAATHSNMGVYDGTVTATAEYEDILYEIMSGTYLPAGSEGELETCPENSYCPGDVDVTYNETTDQGISSCPSGYPNSAAGASSNTQCYTACTVNSANIEHAMAVDGNDYYNTDADTCVATACEGGYHVNEVSEVVEKTPLIDLNYKSNGSKPVGKNPNGSIWGTDTYGLTENGTWAGTYTSGILYGRASCQPVLHDPGLAWVEDNEIDLRLGSMTPEQVRSELTPIAGAAKANYLADVVANIRAGTESESAVIDVMQVVFGVNKNASYSTTSAGRYCYCQIAEFVQTDGNRVNIESAPWVYNEGPLYGSASECAGNCSRDCAQYFVYEMRDLYPTDWQMRGAMLGALDFVAGGTCEGNEITINWTDAADEDIDANNAGMCTYGGDIRTPVAAMEKPGKTFVGWKFSK